MSSSLKHHGLYHTRLLCLPVSLRVCSNWCPLSQWSYLTISSSAAPFFCLQYLSASESFPMSQLFASGDQSIGASLSASVLPMIFVSASLHFSMLFIWPQILISLYNYLSTTNSKGQLHFHSLHQASCIFTRPSSAPGGDMQWIFLQSLQQEPTLSTPWLWTSGFHNCEIIHFCSFKPPRLW